MTGQEPRSIVARDLIAQLHRDQERESADRLAALLERG